MPMCYYENNYTVFCTYSRHLASLKPVRYTFEHIFSSQSNQAEVFERVAIPSVRDVLTGKPALIFMYGVTGSGKTYTMCGKLVEFISVNHNQLDGKRWIVN